MKIKNVCRAEGLLRTGIVTGGNYLLLDTFSKIDYSKLDDLVFADIPVSYKAMGLGWLVLAPVLISGMAFLTLDGIVDIVKGTHHYLGMQTMKRLTKEEEKKRKIESEIADHLSRIEEPIFRIKSGR